MEAYYLLLVALFLIFLCIMQSKKRKNAALINHRKNHRNKELLEMKELAQKFIGKDCLVYTIAGDTGMTKGMILEITDDGILMEYEGNLQAVNLEYVTRIREWPKNAKGKKKTVFE